jgi:hypothetical protein
MKVISTRDAKVFIEEVLCRSFSVVLLSDMSLEGRHNKDAEHTKLAFCDTAYGKVLIGM